MIWNAETHARLAMLFNGIPASADGFEAGQPVHAYAGYKPDVREVPNGDAGHEYGTRYDTCVHCHAYLPVPPEGPCPARASRIDTGKRYLHVAPKYLAQHPGQLQWAADLYDLAFAQACRVATALGVPATYRPHEAYCALRVIEYPAAAHRFTPDSPFFCDRCAKQTHEIGGEPTALGRGACPALALGAGTAEHTDPDLFTLNLWRSHTEDHEHFARDGGAVCGDGWRRGHQPHHMGELGEIVGLGPATPHRVPARPYTQRALVFFAIPDHEAVLPGNKRTTVGEWLGRAIEKRRVRK